MPYINLKRHRKEGVVYSCICNTKASHFLAPIFVANASMFPHAKTFCDKSCPKNACCNALVSIMVRQCLAMLAKDSWACLRYTPLLAVGIGTADAEIWARDHSPVAALGLKLLKTDFLNVRRPWGANTEKSAYGKDFDFTNWWMADTWSAVGSASGVASSSCCLVEAVAQLPQRVKQIGFHTNPRKHRETVLARSLWLTAIPQIGALQKVSVGALNTGGYLLGVWKLSAHTCPIDL